jgi:hypothetical protein
VEVKREEAMIGAVTGRANDPERAAAFYDVIAKELGVGRMMEWLMEWPMEWLME